MPPLRTSRPHASSVHLFIRLSVLLSLTFALGFLTGRLLPRPAVTPPLTVTYIVDGDTVDLSDGRRLRLRGIDAPEGAKGRKIECLGRETKDRLAQLVLNQTVTLTEVSLPKDDFGRTLAVIHLASSRTPCSPPEECTPPPSGEATDPAQILVAEGLARAAGPFPSADYQEKLFTLEEEAKDNQRGLWSPDACPQATPIPIHCNIKGNVHWKKRQKLYFPSDCPGYERIIVEPKNGDRWFCSIEEAGAAGFILSPTCPPLRIRSRIST